MADVASRTTMQVVPILIVPFLTNGLSSAWRRSQSPALQLTLEEMVVPGPKVDVQTLGTQFITIAFINRTRQRVLKLPSSSPHVIPGNLNAGLRRRVA